MLTYALYPQTGGKWVRIKHGLDPMPDEMKPSPPADDGARPVAPSALVQATPKSHRARAFNVFVDGEPFFVEVDPVSTGPSASASAGPVPSAPVSSHPTKVQPGETTVEAPMPGLVLRHEVEVGANVKAGQPVLILEAMKMQNSLPSPVSGTVRALPFDIGSKVSRGDVLAIITP